MLHLKKISNTALLGLLGLAFLAGLCVLAAKANLRLDLTANQRYSLTPQTVKVLDGLSAPVKAVAFFLPRSRAGTSSRTCSTSTPAPRASSPTNSWTRTATPSGPRR